MSGQEPVARVVVVGNGIAGLTAADALRDAGFDGELTIVGDERHPAYSRPALSKALLRDELDAHELPAPTHGATELLGVAATGVVPQRRVVQVGGEELPYDRLVIASGSRARRLTDDPGEVTLRGLDDAFALRERLATRPSVVVVGGGPLGMEVASGALASGCEVTLVSQGRPLITQLGRHLSDLFTTSALEQGLTLVETGSARLDGPSRVLLADGAALEADLIVTAVGDVPNTEWLAGSGLARCGALEVDHRGLLRPDIAAVGDVAALPTPYGTRRIPLWSSAIDQSKVAAAALIRGEEAPPLSIQPYFWTEGFGLSLKAVGFMPPSGEPEYVDGGPGGPALIRWPGAAAAINYRIPIPRLRRAAAA
ncbi:MAG: FAD-dependent oxidoreductase [Frankia sp.]|nr:FAD-dependent oxidoreductase [Frankia sp.]